MRISFASVAFVVTLATAAPAAAQRDTVPEPAIAPSHLAAAKEYLEAMRMQEAAMAGVEISFDTQIASNPMLAPYRGTMMEWAREVFTSPEATEAFARAYAGLLSEEDLRALTAFVRTPLGQRLAARQAELARKGADIGRELAEARQPELMERLMRVQEPATQP